MNELYEEFGDRNVAQICVVKLGIKIPALLDDFDDATDKVYKGWPDRLYVIDRDGAVNRPRRTI